MTREDHFLTNTMWGMSSALHDTCERTIVRSRLHICSFCWLLMLHSETFLSFYTLFMVLGSISAAIEIFSTLDVIAFF